MKRSLLILIVVVAAGIGGVLGAMISLYYVDSSIVPYTSIDGRQQLVLANYDRDTAYNIPEGLDFRTAANQVKPGVVHIRTSYGSGEFSINPLEVYRHQPTRSSGSGVIISDDGYIVTNNHVIEDATNIEVIMNNNQRFFAKLVGTDPSTDLALLKVKAKGLPFIPYGDSDRINPGEWVLAVGNPFDLTSTVTAGIVSATARNIGILRDVNNLQVESFIQTDAAVNPGNSGGALVNLQGELVGINTAIATSSGSYQGYSFAIPVSLVRKVVDDLLEFGQVQRGLLGIQIQDVNASIAEDLGLEMSQGVLINRINESSAAEQAGLERYDVIVGINHHQVNSVSELQEWVARNRPGTEIAVSYVRDGQRHEVKARLRNNDGSASVVEKEIAYELGGATFEDVPYKELAQLSLEGGVRVATVKPGKMYKGGLKEGFIIAYVDKLPVDDVKDLNRILEYKAGGILIEGFTKEGTKAVLGVDW